MDRRSFIRLGLLGGWAGVIAPSLVLSGCHGHKMKHGHHHAHNDEGMAGGIYYTKEAPGRWSSKVAPHLPIIEKQSSSGGVKIQVTTKHGMKSWDHYIVKHMILNEDFKFIDEQMFTPGKDKNAISTYDLKNYSGPLYALSLCNKHDNWLDMIEI